MLSNFQLEEMAHKRRIKPFIGVFSKDQLPNPKKKGFYIINMEDANQGGGTHWVCAEEKGDAGSIYFDSYGVVPPNSVVSYFSKPIRYVSDQVQHLDSEKCGWFALHMCKELSKGRRLKNIMEDFTTDPDKLMDNDKVI